jgi:hypothetical protein
MGTVLEAKQRSWERPLSHDCQPDSWEDHLCRGLASVHPRCTQQQTRAPACPLKAMLPWCPKYPQGWMALVSACEKFMHQPPFWSLFMVVADFSCGFGRFYRHLKCTPAQHPKYQNGAWLTTMACIFCICVVSCACTWTHIQIHAELMCIHMHEYVTNLSHEQVSRGLFWPIFAFKKPSIPTNKRLSTNTLKTDVEQNNSQLTTNRERPRFDRGIYGYNII